MVTLHSLIFEVDCTAQPLDDLGLFHTCTHWHKHRIISNKQWSIKLSNSEHKPLEAVLLAQQSGKYLIIV